MTALDQAIEAVQNGMSLRGAAKEYGVPRTTLRRRVMAIPDGFKLKGTSTLYDKEGNVKIQWVKTTEDEERQKAVMDAALAAMKQSLPRLAPCQAPQSTLSELANCYVITDFHLGMMAWHKEGGDDWDLNIAENVLIGCFSQMLSSAPDAQTGVICQLGDFMHSDGSGLLPITPTSGNVLDQDGRFSKIVQTAIRVLRRVIDMALHKHEKIHVIMAEGNHDLASSIWLRELFATLYENEPRIYVDTSIAPFYCYQHGSTMLAFHHGHMKKMQGLGGFFAAQFPRIWGDTEYRYGHCGHMHHKHVLEDAGITITQHRTLAAKDSFSSRHGYHADRGAECITYHTKHGQVATNNVTPEMIE